MNSRRCQEWVAKFCHSYDLACGLARRGDLFHSITAIEQARKILDGKRLNLTTPIFLASHSFAFLQLSAYSTAQNLSGLSWLTAIKHLRVMDVCLRGLAWHLECVAGTNGLSSPGTLDRRLIRRRCRWAQFLTWFHIKLRPHLLRSRGRAFTALGKTHKGIHNFELAVKSARQLEMQYDLRKSRLDLAAVKEER